MENKSKTTRITPGFGADRDVNESIGSVVRRFNQQVRESGVLVKARRRRFRQPRVNKRARRTSALVRVERRETYKKLRKWGKVK